MGKKVKKLKLGKKKTTASVKKAVVKEFLDQIGNDDFTRFLKDNNFVRECDIPFFEERKKWWLNKFEEEFEEHLRRRDS